MIQRLAYSLQAQVSAGTVVVRLLAENALHNFTPFMYQLWSLQHSSSPNRKLQVVALHLSTSSLNLMLTVLTPNGKLD